MQRYELVNFNRVAGEWRLIFMFTDKIVQEKLSNELHNTKDYIQ
jgi:hypothetical protein